MKTYSYEVKSNLGLRYGVIEARHKLKAQMRIHEKLVKQGYKDFKITIQ